MQVFTNSQVRSLQITAQAAYDALVIVEDVVCSTLDRVLCVAMSDNALRFYSRAIFGVRAAWEVAKVTAILAGGLAFYAGVLSRYGWEWLMSQCDRLVEDCLSQPAVEPTLVLTPVTTPIALLQPATDEPRTLITPAPVEPDVCSTPIETVCVPASEVTVELPVVPLLAPASEVAIAPTKTATRTRKAATTATAKKTTRKTGGKAKAKVENVEA